LTLDRSLDHPEAIRLGYNDQVAFLMLGLRRLSGWAAAPAPRPSTASFDGLAARRDACAMARGNDELVWSSLEAFLRGDWEQLRRVMDPEVD
jgi:hypothetical protein